MFIILKNDMKCQLNEYVKFLILKRWKVYSSNHDTFVVKIGDRNPSYRRNLNQSSLLCLIRWNIPKEDSSRKTRV